MLISCNSQEISIDRDKDNRNIIDENELVEAYIYAENIAVWNSVFLGEKTYDDVAKRKIHEDEILKVYREKDKDSYTNEERYIYYFMGNEKIKSGLLKNKVVDSCVSLQYYIEKGTWQTMFAASDKKIIEELISKGKAEFIGEIRVVYSNAYFPKANLTEYKRKVLKEVKSYIKNYLKKGKYRIFVRDFSDADQGTDVMVQNKKGEICTVPITFAEYLEVGFSVGSPTNVSPEFIKDYSLGGIKYSELFSKLSVEHYNKQN